MREEKSCGAVVFRREGEKTLFLLLEYFGNYYDFPKGNQEPGEEEQATARREIEEETGIRDVRFIEDFHEIITYFYQRESEVTHKTVAFFLAETSVADVRISYEHKGYKWLPFEEAEAVLKFANSKDILKKVHAFLEGSLMRFKEG